MRGLRRVRREDAKKTLVERQAAHERADRRGAAGLLRQRARLGRRQARADHATARCATTAPDKLPSLDWKIAFSGLATRFTSRIVSTGDNFFINLGGQDFEAGQQAVQQLDRPGAASRSRRGSRRSGSTRSRPCATSRQAGDAQVRRRKTLTVYTGAIDVDVVHRPDRAAEPGPARPPAPRRRSRGGKLTAEQRAQAKRTFAKPRFEVGRGRRRHHPPARWSPRPSRPPAANREAAGGITGGAHRVPASSYTEVGEDDHDHAAEGPAAALRLRAAGPADPVEASWLVTHPRQVEAVRRRGAARLAARRALEQRARSPRALRRPPATSSIVPTRTRFMWRMNVSASIRNSSTSPSRSQRAREDVALEAPVVGLGRA